MKVSLLFSNVRGVFIQRSLLHSLHLVVIFLLNGLVLMVTLLQETV